MALFLSLFFFANTFHPHILKENHNFLTDLKAIKQVKDVTEYETVIIGSSIFYGKWRKDATEFVQNHQSELTSKKVFYFLTCMTLGNGNKEKLVEVEDFLVSERKLVKPILEGRFAGEVNLKKLGFLHKLIIKMVKSPTGDFRDWNKIEDWVKGVIKEL
jgi:menaquinone-dependent protoporphyrinogen oxidase